MLFKQACAIGSGNMNYVVHVISPPAIDRWLAKVMKLAGEHTEFEVWLFRARKNEITEEKEPDEDVPLECSRGVVWDVVANTVRNMVQRADAQGGDVVPEFVKIAFSNTQCRCVVTYESEQSEKTA